MTLLWVHFSPIRGGGNTDPKNCIQKKMDQLLDELTKKFGVCESLANVAATPISSAAVKVPLVCGYVARVLSHTHTDAVVLLQDRTTTNSGVPVCIHAEVLALYPTALQPGTVLVVKDVTYIPRLVSLIVTPRNVVAVFEASSTTPPMDVAAPSSTLSGPIIEFTTHQEEREVPTWVASSTGLELEIADDGDY